MKTVEQPTATWAQFMLGALHLYAMSIAGVAFVVHGAAVMHHWQRAGLISDAPADETADHADAFLRGHR